MLYQNLDSYTPGLKMQKDGFIILDLARLQKPVFKEICKRIGEENKISQEIVESSFADTLLTPEDLNLKIKAVILPFDCFIRAFRPIGQQSGSFNNCTPFQYLKKKYESYLTIGLKINLQQEEQTAKLKELSILKKLKLFSFDLTESGLQKQLPVMRQYVRELFKIDKKIHFHIKIDLSSTTGLKLLKQQLILHEYPIQYCMLQTNLINLVQAHFGLNCSQNWEEIAFKYTKTIGKYVPSAVGCLLESYLLTAQSELKDLKRIFTCINLVNMRNQREERLYKSFHNTGLGILQPLLVRLLKDFSPDEYGHSRVRGNWSIYLGKMYDIVIGKYQHEQKHQLFDQGPVQSD